MTGEPSPSRAAKLKAKLYLPMIIFIFMIFVFSSFFIRPFPSSFNLSREPLYFDNDVIKQRIQAVSCLTSYEKIGWLAKKFESNGMNVFRVKGGSSSICGESEGLGKGGPVSLVVARLSGFKTDSSVVALISTLAEAISGRGHARDIILCATYDDVSQVEDEVLRRFGSKPDTIVLNLLGTDLRKLELSALGKDELPLWSIGMFRKSLSQQGVQASSVTSKISDSVSKELQVEISTCQEVEGNEHSVGLARTVGRALERAILTLDNMAEKPQEKPYLPLLYTAYLPYGALWFCLLALIMPFLLRTAELSEKSKWSRLSLLWKRKSWRESAFTLIIAVMVVAAVTIIFSGLGVGSIAIYPVWGSAALLAFSRRTPGYKRSFPKGYRTIFLKTTNTIFCIFVLIVFLLQPVSVISLLPTLFLWIFISANRRNNGLLQIAFLLMGIAALFIARPEGGLGDLTPLILTAIIFYSLSIWKVATIKEGERKIATARIPAASAQNASLLLEMRTS